jgi:hypothetical protein
VGGDRQAELADQQQPGHQQWHSSIAAHVPIIRVT